MKQYHLGFDAFFSEAGRFKQRSCLVCGTPCDIERDKIGPRNSIEAMALRIGRLRLKGLPLHDAFHCPHANERWHQQALQLKKEERQTSSPTLRTIINSDLQNLLNLHLRR